MKAFLAFIFLALLWVASPVQARNPHGVSTNNISESFGADTLKGFGGLSYADLNYGGAAGTLSITTQTDASSTSVSTFTIDADNNIVPAGTYGSAPPIWNGPYQLVLTGTGYMATLNISIVSGQAHWTIMCQSLTGTTCNDAAGHSDTITNSQLRTYVGKSWAGSETIIGRNTPCSPTCSIGFSQAGTQFKVAPPVGGYGGQLIITAETPTKGTPWGEVCWDQTTAGDININTKLTGIIHYSNFAGPMAVNNSLIEACSVTKGWGITIDSDSFGLGPAVTNPFRINGFAWNYSPTADGSGCGGGSVVACLVATIKNSTFDNLTSVIKCTNAVVVTGQPLLACDIENNTISNDHEDAIDVNPSALTVVKGNLVYHPDTCCGFHPDTTQLFSSSFLSPHIASCGDYERNIYVRGTSNLGNIISAGTTTTPGTGYTNGTYVAAILTGGHGKWADANITISGGGITAITFPSNEGIGGGYQVGDVLHILPAASQTSGNLTIGAGSGDQITVTSVAAGRGDFETGPFFHNVGAPCDGITVKNNIEIVSLNGNGLNIGFVNNIIANNNIFLYDVQAAGGGGPNGGPIIINAGNNSSPGNNGNFDYNAANGWGIGFETGTVTCLPGTAPSSCISIPTTQAAYKIIAPAWDTSTLPTTLTRADVLAMIAPTNVGDVIYSWAIWPVNNFGEKCWATTAAFDHTKTCVAQGTSVAQ